MDQNDDRNLDGRLHGEQPQVEPDGLAMRLIYMLLIALMIYIGYTVLTFLTVIQFVIMLLSGGRPNSRLADFGTDLGIWLAKAARYQTAASDVKPWPWTDLD